MPNKLTIDNFGTKGVNVDKAQDDLEDDELTSAQNAIYELHGGGLRNRPGLIEFNAAGAGGSILGGIGVPFSSTTGTISSSGSVDTAPLYLSAMTAAGATRGWYTSSNLFVANAVTTAINPWHKPANADVFLNGGPRMGVFHKGRMYYAGDNYTEGVTSPTVRVFNGVDDFELCRILPATTKSIVSMWSDHGGLYICTLDSGTDDTTYVGRVFLLDTTSGRLTQMGTAIATGHIPFSVAVHNGSLFVGTIRSLQTSTANVYRMNPVSDTTWTLDATFIATQYAITCLASFQGLLYASVSGGAAIKGAVRQRSIAGTWSNVDTSSANNGNVQALIVFKNVLYVNYRFYAGGGNQSDIRKSVDGTVWTDSLIAGSNGRNLHVYGLRLFAIDDPISIRHTLDGVTWTSTVGWPSPTGGDYGGIFGTFIR